MKQRKRQGTGEGTTHVTDKKARAAANIRATAAILATRVVDEHDEEQDELAFSDGALEPPELEDLADSSAFVEPSPPGAIFDRLWSEDLPLAGQLPSRLRPPVRYRIDAEGVVHAQYRRPAPDVDPDLELAVARAIARHIREAGIRLESAGDWRKIPAIESVEKLEELDEALQGGMHSLGSVVKAFAIELPSRDVVVPEALIAGQVPRRLRPPVRYRIDAEGVVHLQYRRPAPDSDLDLELAVARAIARHIQETGIRLESAGDWCKIPAIGMDENLEELDEALQGKMHSLGSVLKAFAIELPSRDVVVPEALIRAAGTTTKATLAGALRMQAVDRLEELLIDSDERARFAEARRKEKNRAATSSDRQAPETRRS